MHFAINCVSFWHKFGSRLRGRRHDVHIAKARHRLSPAPKRPDRSLDTASFEFAQHRRLLLVNKASPDHDCLRAHWHRDGTHTSENPPRTKPIFFTMLCDASRHFAVAVAARRTLQRSPKLTDNETSVAGMSAAKKTMLCTAIPSFPQARRPVRPAFDDARMSAEVRNRLRASPAHASCKRSWNTSATQ